MSDLYELHEDLELSEPVLLVHLDGWIDAGLAAANAMGTILEDLDTVTVATFDTDTLLDHRSRRPTMSISDGVVESLTWPSIELRAGFDLDGNAALFLVGAEPDHVWRAFAESVATLCLHFGVVEAFSLGAYPAPVPHTRSGRMVATAVRPELARSIGVAPGRIDVPGGVDTAIQQACVANGVGMTGLWAQVPHYAAGMPWPEGALTLVNGLRTIAGLRFPTGSLLEDSQATRTRLDELVAGNDEHLGMVRQLEMLVDADPQSGDTLPTGDDIVAELEQFLREQE